MIIEVEGDILQSKAQVIAHGVAANDPMSQGLAKSLHESLPAMHKEYHQWCHTHHPKPGEIWSWISEDNVCIVNLITQEGGYGHGSQARPGKATLKNVSHALHALNKFVIENKYESLAIPRVATGVGNLDWADVFPIIQKQLGDLDIPVYVYSEFIEGLPANEN